MGNLSKKKLIAFTIQELIIVMVISSVLMSMAYFSYMTIHQYYRIYDHQSKEILELYRLINTLENDLLQSDSINLENNQLSTIGGKLNITYCFESNYAVRKGIVADTFRFEGGEIQISTFPVCDKMKTDLFKDHVTIFLDSNSCLEYKKEATSHNLVTLTFGM